jgi:hypothetical protein
MAKKSSKRSRKTAEPPAGLDMSWEEYQQTVQELVDMGYVMRVVDNDSGEMVYVAVPEELRVHSKVDAQARADEDRALLQQREMPPRVEKLLKSKAFAMWHGFKRLGLAPLLELLTGRPAKEMFEQMDARAETAAMRFVEDVIFQGFDFSLERYADKLKDVPELAAWHNKRAAGGAKGRATLSAARERRAQSIRDMWAAMESAGEKPTNATVAAACKCGVSTVIRAFRNGSAKQAKS